MISERGRLFIADVVYSDQELFDEDIKLHNAINQRLKYPILGSFRRDEDIFYSSDMDEELTSA